MLDALLLLMVIIWGANFAVVKAAVVDFPPLVFNAIRLVIATGLFGLALGLQARRGLAAPAIRPGEWRRIVVLGLIGHAVYQVCFVSGVARTSVGNSALIFACTPVTVALMASWAGHERIPPMRWAGVVLSLAGVYLVVGHRASWSAEGLIGDGLMFAAMFCWSLYSVLAQPLLRRHSPLVVTGLSMVVGAMLYVIVTSQEILATDWAAIPASSWIMMAASAVLALFVAYLIWYTGVQRIGSSRTSIYNNLTPIVALAVGALWLGEPVSTAQIAGTAAILAGVFVTRIARSAPAAGTDDEAVPLPEDRGDSHVQDPGGGA